MIRPTSRFNSGPWSSTFNGHRPVQFSVREEQKGPVSTTLVQKFPLDPIYSSLHKGEVFGPSDRELSIVQFQ